MADIPESIQALLRLTTDLVDVYDNSRGELRTEEHIDIDQTTDQLSGLLDVLEKLLKAVTDPMEPTTLAPATDEINGLLTKCKQDIGELETAIKRQSGWQSMKGQSSTWSSEMILSNLASSTTALRDIVDRYTSSSARINPRDSTFPNPIDSHYSTDVNVHQVVASDDSGNTYPPSVMIETAAYVRNADGRQGSALVTASLNGREEIVRTLLEGGAEVNWVEQGYGSALEVASAGGHEAIVKTLLESGASVNTVGGIAHGSPLASAAAIGHKEIVQLLLESGASVNTSGGVYGSPLASAAGEGREEIVRILLEAGADVNFRDEHGRSAMTHAHEGSHRAVIQLLLENGANAEGGRVTDASSEPASSSSAEQVEVDQTEKPLVPIATYSSPSTAQRPANAFMLFQRHYLEKLRAETEEAGGDKQKQKQKQPSDLSKIANNAWREQSVEERKVWEDLAKKGKEEHQRLHPEHSFRPSRSAGRRSKGSSHVNLPLSPPSTIEIMPLTVALAEVVKGNDSSSNSIPVVPPTPISYFIDLVEEPADNPTIPERKPEPMSYWIDLVEVEEANDSLNDLIPVSPPGPEAIWVDLTEQAPNDSRQGIPETRPHPMSLSIVLGDISTTDRI